MISQPPADRPSADTDMPVWRQRARRAWHYARWPVYAGAALFGLLVVAGVWLWVTTDLPEADVAGDSAILVDRNGTNSQYWPRTVSISGATRGRRPSVVDALVAAEDQRFYEHDGVDPVGIVRALWNNVRTTTSRADRRSPSSW